MGKVRGERSARCGGNEATRRKHPASQQRWKCVVLIYDISVILIASIKFLKQGFTRILLYLTICTPMYRWTVFQNPFKEWVKIINSCILFCVMCSTVIKMPCASAVKMLLFQFSALWKKHLSHVKHKPRQQQTLRHLCKNWYTDICLLTVEMLWY